IQLCVQENSGLTNLKSNSSLPTRSIT
ncbi:hypothetical protein CPC197_0711B, partial [Chlamydia psittaci C1/97]